MSAKKKTAAKKTARKKPAPKRGRGRPTDYRQEYAVQAEKLCMLGATDAEMADFFQVTDRSINRWKLAHPEFCQALKRGKMLADAEVANRLYGRAMGYSCPETKFATFEGMITDQREITKHYPPDTTAAIFWLKNRQPGKWRDKIDHEHEFTGDLHVVLGKNAEEA